MLIVSKDVDTHGDNDTLAKRNTSDPPINEEGDAPCMPIKQEDNAIDAKAVQSSTSKRLDRNPYSTYKHFARNANRTLTTFTNEMSELLRQSIERLDSISMKVRGCVYEIEKQRVGMIGILGDGCSNMQQSAQNVSKLCSRPYQYSTRILGEIEENVALGNTENSWASEKSKDETLKEFAVKCRKHSFIAPIERKLSNVSEQCEANSECQFTEVLQDEKRSKINSPRLDEKRPTTSTLSSGRATPDQSRISMRKQPALPMSFNTDANEKEVMNKIVKQHRQLRAGIENENSQLEQMRDKYETRPKRKLRAKKEPVNSTNNKPTKKRVQSKLVNDAYVKENYNDNLWFGPQLSSGSRKSIKSARNNPDASTASKVAQIKNTKLARKFASFNFHDPSQKHAPAKVESYTGGKLVYLASDSHQDWSVYMHTQKSPTRYDLKQNSQFPTNNILDEITLKDLEPLKAEYPRRDHILESNVSVEDSLLYKLVNGGASSLECLISVNANAKTQPETVANPVNIAMVKKCTKRANIIPQKSAALQISPNTTTHTKAPVQHSPQAPQHVQNPRQKNIQKTKQLKQVQVDPNELSRGDDKTNMRRAGINRSSERKRQTTTGKKNNTDPKKIVAAESKRIAQRLSDIKSNVKYTLSSTKSNSMQDYQIYRQMSKKDARKRLKKYVNNPTKTHQKYMVMMVNEMSYDNYKLNKDGLYQAKSRSVAEILAPYIYVTEAPIIPKQELTIAMMTTYSTAQQNAKPRKLDPAKVAGIKRGVDMSFVNSHKPVIHINEKPGHSRDIKRHVGSRSASMERYAQASGIFPGKVDEQSAWKQAIRSCFNTHHEYPPSTNAKSLNANQMNAIVMSMEQQLKHVMDNPKIENKSTVIKGLQEEMEWILSNIEGHSNALKQRRGINTYETRKDMAVRRKLSEKRVPVLKPAEPKSQKPSTVVPKSNTVLKKASGNLIIPKNQEPTNSDAQEMQTKLMSKWQWLEHPSAESMGSEPMKRNEELNALKMLVRAQPKRSNSKPETRRENLVNSFGSPNAIVQMVTTKCDNNLLNDRTEDISEDNEINEDILMPIKEVECKASDISIYTSCDDLHNDSSDKTESKNSNSNNSHLTEEEIITYQNNIKRLERQLSEETERFVEEIHEVMSKVELSKDGSNENHILEPMMNAVKEYKESEESKTDSLLSNTCDAPEVHKVTRVEQATQIAGKGSTKSAVTYICSMLDSALLTSPIAEKKSSADKETDVRPMPTAQSISLTLNHNLRKAIGNPLKSYTVDARSFKSLDSPMMQGIKRDLFGSAHVNYPLSRISLMRKPPKMAAGTSVSLTNMFKKESNEKRKKISVGVSRSETVTALMTASTCQTDFYKNTSEATEPLNITVKHTMKQRTRKVKRTPNLLNEEVGQDYSEARRSYRNVLSFCYTVIFVVMFFGLNLHYVCG